MRLMRRKVKFGILLLWLPLVAIAPGSALAGQPEFEAITPPTVFPIVFIGPQVGASEISFGGVSCLHGSTSGEISNRTTLRGLSIKFTGCKESPFGTPCTSSGGLPGEIRTTALAGKTVYLKPASGEAGVLLKPESGTSFSSYSCTISGSHNLTGELVCHITAAELRCATSGGAQTPTSYLNPTGCAVVSGIALKDNGVTTGYVNETTSLPFSSTLTLNSTAC
jgi:hypothetical protein